MPLLNGCATITSGSEQEIRVDTGKDQNATCQLRNEEGTWQIQKTPAVVNVKRCNSPLTIQCKKDDKLGAKSLEPGMNAMALGNLPMIGGVVWAMVDVGTGAAFDYPEAVSVPLTAAKGS